jgi:predicted RNase H-like nuclease (RuvC/YqgF family)
MKSAWSAWSAKALVLTALWLSIGEAALTGDTLSSGSPVAKIVEMLKDMSSKSDEDGKAEEETFSSFKCHSTKVIESKATKMSDLEELSLSLENKIEKLTALKGELASKAVSVKKDLEKMMKQKGRLTAPVRTVTRAFSPARRR